MWDRGHLVGPNAHHLVVVSAILFIIQCWVSEKKKHFAIGLHFGLDFGLIDHHIGWCFASSKQSLQTIRKSIYLRKDCKLINRRQRVDREELQCDECKSEIENDNQTKTSEQSFIFDTIAARNVMWLLYLLHNQEMLFTIPFNEQQLLWIIFKILFSNEGELFLELYTGLLKFARARKILSEKVSTSPSCRRRLGVRATSLSRFEFFPRCEDKKVNNSISSPLCSRIAKAPYLTTKGFKSVLSSSRGNFFFSKFSSSFICVGAQLKNKLVWGLDQKLP